MTRVLDESYLRDKRVWNTCAQTYEEHIVEGHPDVTAYEAFEEDFLDHLLLYLARDQGLNLSLYDVGCGSARLHQRYGLKIADIPKLTQEDAALVNSMRNGRFRFSSECWLAERLIQIRGIDFSGAMIELARTKLQRSGLKDLLDVRLFLQEGSAFDLGPLDPSPVPVIVCVCNSIGVMQGPQGAIELFKSLRRAVEACHGIAIISAYRGESVRSHALGNYESTLEVCGMPRWLGPGYWACPDHILKVRQYKRAHDPSSSLLVDIFDKTGTILELGVTLERIPCEVEYTIQSCHIRTYSDYQSHWYPFDQFREWIATYWPGEHSYHLAGSELDRIRAEPVQLAILDPGARLRPFFERLGVI